MNFKKYHVSRNLIPFPYHTGTQSVDGILWTMNSDGRLIGDGTSTKGTNYYIINQLQGFSLNAGDYTLSFQGAKNRNLILRDITAGVNIARCDGTNKEVSFTLSEDSGVLQLYFNTSAADTEFDIDGYPMLNEGSTALPYEPYSSEVWHDIPHYVHKTSTDTLTTLPAVLYPTGTTATVGLKGNTLQSSVPSPTSPVMPQGTGERTGNLFDKSTVILGERVLASSVVADAGAAHSDYIDVTGISTLTVNKKYAATNFYFYADKTNTSIGYVNNFTANVPTGAKYCRINVLKEDVDTIMLNLGSTALPYEPWGVKIPILSNSTTTPVYLGEVETTRKIKKLVLKGTENWYDVPTNGVYYTNVVKDLANKNNYTPKCSHYKLIQQTTIANLTDGSFTSDNNVFFWFKESSITSLADWKAYLAQQYANGTPVTVWYVLATKETAVVNEPLMKIGDYADSISGITIPVTAGGDTLSVGTTVQPSEVTVNYKGWHPVADVHERENGAWT